MNQRFDTTFVRFFGVMNMNHGLWIMVKLAALAYYKDYCKLDPGDVQLYMALINLPWAFKLLYGLISDNIPIFGYKRKFYLIIFSFVEFCSVMALFVFEPENPILVTLCLISANFCLAFIMVVSEAIMVT